MKQVIQLWDISVRGSLETRHSKPYGMSILASQAGLALVFASFIAGCAAPPAPPAQPKQVAQQVEIPIDFSKRARLIDGDEGARLIFPDRLLFESGKSKLSAEAARSVDACRFILDRATGTIVVEGHTDATGGDALNQRLSKERAEAVKAALINRNIAAGRIEVRGLAATKPEVPNATTEEQHAFNRRAEIIFKGISAANLNAPHGCGGPPETKTVMVDVEAPPPSKQLSPWEQLQADIKSAAERALKR